MERLIAFTLILCVVAIFIAILLFGFIFSAISNDEKETTRIIGQCVKDGHKEYECHAMIINRE